MNNISKKELRKLIRETTGEITDEQLFSCSIFKEHLEGLIFDMTFNRNIDLQLKAINNNETAYTYGDNITCNLLSPVVTDKCRRDERYLSIVGLITHECGHLLYTDFNIINKIRGSWTRFKWYQLTDEQEQKVKEIDSYVEKYPKIAQRYFSSLNDMVNILEDIYIENRIFNDFSGICTQGLCRINNSLYKLSPKENELYHIYSSGRILLIELMLTIMQIRSKGFPSNLDLTDSLSLIEIEAKSKVDNVFNKCINLIEQISYETNSERRVYLFNEIAIRLFELLPKLEDNNNNDQNDDANDQSKGNQNSNNSFPDEKDDQKNNQRSNDQFSDGENNSQSNNSKSDDNSRNPQDNRKPSSLSEDDICNQLMSEASLDNLQKNCGKTIMPNRSNQSPVSNNNEVQKDEINKKREDTQKAVENGTTDSKLNISKLEDEIKQEITDNLTECVTAQNLQSEANQLMEELRIQYNHNCSSRESLKIHKVSKKNITKYKDYYFHIAKLADKTAKKISNILKIRKNDGCDSGYYFGKKLEANRLYKNSGRYFSRTVLPEGAPDVSFALLVDLSGSMNGNRAIRALSNAILLDDILTRLNIPHGIYGFHTPNGSQTDIWKFKDFDDTDNCKYLLPNIIEIVKSGYANNDGVAINFVGKILQLQQTEKKVLIAISDGRPTDACYNQTPVQFVKEAISNCRKNGITVFGTVLEENSLSAKSIMDIYGEKYSFHCYDEDTLSKTFVKLIKRFVLND